MRTNIDLDDKLVTKVKKILGTTTKKATIDEALRRVLRNHEARRAIERLAGLGWEGDLDAMRQGRTFDHIK
jgi:Arc/MetJ family transcription regulator